MKKKVYLIKGFAKTDHESKAMDFYFNEFLKYFKSKAGGGWIENEIVYLDSPNSLDLKKIISSSLLDYSVSVFIGHGATQDSNQLFQINKDEIIRAGQFINGSPKQLLIFESCRSKINNIPTTDLSDKIPKFEKGGYVRAPISIEKSREIFLKDIANSKSEVVACFACSEGETASNFYFSYLLLSTAMNWHLETSNHVESLKISELMTQIIRHAPKIIMSQIGTKQTPQIIGNSNFPFTISKF